ncbi:hypothetical protein SHJJP8915_001064 [Staphylococcus lugdunensis]|uniref:hypothetical protein n=1 Tax=Staphylococcus lugdunensis TaxID=28035 RepID=UPI001F4D2890|nr:hypothetical protein [Staphylococcus lugdunensis]MCH8680072.1 hypothetical protein [Staphylococcus lugdunensis]
MRALDLIEELQDAMEHYGDFDVKTERNEDIELKHIYSFQPEATAVINVKGRMPIVNLNGKRYRLCDVYKYFDVADSTVRKRYKQGLRGAELIYGKGHYFFEGDN